MRTAACVAWNDDALKLFTYYKLLGNPNITLLSLSVAEFWMTSGRWKSRALRVLRWRLLRAAVWARRG